MSSGMVSRVAVALLIAATLSSALLGVRTYRSFLLLLGVRGRFPADELHPAVDDA